MWRLYLQDNSLVKTTGWIITIAFFAKKPSLLSLNECAPAQLILTRTLLERELNFTQNTQNALSYEVEDYMVNSGFRISRHSDPFGSGARM